MGGVAWGYKEGKIFLQTFYHPALLVLNHFWSSLKIDILFSLIFIFFKIDNTDLMAYSNMHMFIEQFTPQNDDLI